MSKKRTVIFVIVVAVIIAALVAGIVLTDGLYERTGDINETMQDAVLHEGDKISLFGLRRHGHLAPLCSDRPSLRHSQIYLYPE